MRERLSAVSQPIAIPPAETVVVLFDADKIGEVGF